MGGRRPRCFAGTPKLEVSSCRGPAGPPTSRKLADCPMHDLREGALMHATTRDAATGVAGLDDVLSGGLQRGRVFLLEGNPGTGKTTVALHFLRTGAALGERCLYVTLSETEDELRATVASH